MAIFVFADVLEAHGCTIVPIGDDALILDDEGTDLPSLAVGVLGPYTSHTEVPLIQYELLLLNSRHCLSCRIALMPLRSDKDTALSSQRSSRGKILLEPRLEFTRC